MSLADGDAGERFRREPEPPSFRRILRRFAPEVRPFRLGLAGLLLLSLVSPLAETAGVWLFKLLIDRVLVPRDFAPLGWLALLFFVITVVDGAASYCERILATAVSERFVLGLRERVFRHTLGLSLDFLEKRRLGDLLSRLSGDVAGVESLLVSGTVGAFSDLLRVLFFAGALFYLEWRLALVALIALPLFSIAVRRFSGRIRETSRQARKQSGLVTSVAEEALSSAVMVQAYGREDHEAARLAREGRLGIAAHLAAARLRGLFAVLVDLIQLAGGLAVVGLGTWSLSSGTLTLGGLLGFVTYLGKLYRPVRSLGSFVHSAYSASAGAERVLELLDEEPSPADRPGARALPAAIGAIAFDDVSFRYPETSRDVLSGISFRVEPGEIVAIVGDSGSGKSTIAKLLLRFFDPTAGKVTLDGCDLRDLTRASLRRASALVLQETMLLHASVRENIAYGCPDAGADAILRAAGDADALGFLAELPEGLDTIVGQKGRRLSGGQRQRVALARAMVRNAPVLILDEPTTGLDPASALRVLEPLRRAMSGRATVLISHDLVAVAEATRILVLDSGHIVESGTHRELLAAGGRYAALHRARSERLRDAGVSA